MATIPLRSVSGRESSSPAPKQEARVIVALDFGNCWTSVAYLSIGTKANDTFEKIDDIRILKGWPTEFEPIHKWIRMGLEDKPRDQELKSLVNLINEARYSNLANSVPPELYKSPKQIARDYLRHIAEQVLDELLNNAGRHVFESFPIDLVASYPSVWGEAYKRRYFRVLKWAFDAVFPKLRHVYFVGETYATAYWGVLSLWERGYTGRKLREDTSILVCNTERGSSTAISATYRLVDIDNNQVNFQLHRVGYESKTSAGWSKVDQAIDLLLRQRLGPEDADRLFEHDYESSTPFVNTKLRMLHGRLEAITHGFDGLEQKLGFPVQLPRGIGTNDNPEMGILNGAIKISVDDLKGFFDPSVHSIIGLLSRQIALADYAGAPVKAIALTGSFAHQTYVARRIKEFGRSRRIDITGHDGEVCDATAHGSIACVVGSSKEIPVLVLTMHYGICHSPKFDRTKHRPEDLRITPENGNERAEGQIKWLFTKGEAIFPDVDNQRRENLDMIRKFRQQDFLPGKVSRIVFVTCTCSVDSRPNRMLDLESQNSGIFNLDFELSLVPETERRAVERQDPKTKGRLFGKGVLKSSYFDVNLSADVKIDVSGVKFSVSCGSKVLVEKTIPHLL